MAMWSEDGQPPVLFKAFLLCYFLHRLTCFVYL